MSKEYRSGIGVMSGTSLDGIDLAWCTFERTGSHWTYRIDKACTMPYEAAMREKLAHATDLSALEYAQLDVELGALIVRQAGLHCLARAYGFPPAQQRVNYPDWKRGGHCRAHGRHHGLRFPNFGCGDGRTGCPFGAYRRRTVVRAI